MAKGNPEVRHGDLLFFAALDEPVLVIAEPAGGNLHLMKSDKDVSHLEGVEDLRKFTIIMNIFDVVKEANNAS